VPPLINLPFEAGQDMQDASSHCYMMIFVVGTWHQLQYVFTP